MIRTRSTRRHTRRTIEQPTPADIAAAYRLQHPNRLRAIGRVERREQIRAAARTASVA